jgi:uncharacterized membrane protein
MSKVFWGFYLLLTFLATLPVSWWVLSNTDFAYPVLYDQIGVAEHIERYAPKNNKHKLGFELTSKEKRLELFHQVTESIQHQGKGLAELNYQGENNQTVALFTAAEVTHLQDVANLLDKLKPLSMGLIILWLSVGLVLLLKKVRLPGVKQWLMNALVLALVVAAILALGPEKIFNQLHVWIFPDNHQWFFYYEESLMSTMMKAPDIFGFIAGIFGLMSVFFTALLISLLYKLSHKLGR